MLQPPSIQGIIREKLIEPNVAHPIDGVLEMGVHGYEVFGMGVPDCEQRGKFALYRTL